jgi:hypothetical protein
MLEGSKGNFRNHYLGGKANCEGWNQVLDTQSHVVECDDYANINEGIGLSKDSDLVLFFANVLKRREESEK